MSKAIEFEFKIKMCYNSIAFVIPVYGYVTIVICTLLLLRHVSNDCALSI